MSVRNFSALFHPSTIAIVGASNQPDTVGQVLMRNVLAGGHDGAVFPVNPKYDVVQGVPAFRSVADLPQPPDLAIVAIPAAGVPKLVDQLGALGTRAVVVVSAGFREIGAAGAALEKKLDEVRAKYEGLRILGPNCLGFIVPWLNLNASFAGTMCKPGRVAFVSQSGALCTAILDWARSEDLGFSFFGSLGNMLDVDFADLIDHLADDEHTDALVLYIESIGRARDFLSAARAFTRRKPIVVYKGGRTPQSAQAAASHTGALAGLDAAYEAAFRRAAMVRVFDSRQLVNCAEMLARSPVPAGPKLAILTNAGGPGVMATDALMESHGRLAEFSAQTTAALNAALPVCWSHRNPVDVLGDATPERFAAAARLLIEDEQVDALLAILTPQAMTRPTETAEQLAAAVARKNKPTLAAWMGGESMAAGRAVLDRSAIPTLNTPEEAVLAFSYLASYAQNLQSLYQSPRAVPLPMATSTTARREQISTLIGVGRRLLDEPTSKQLLGLYGIPRTEARIAHDAQQAVERAAEIGFPVVMKILSPDITHKSDVDGVRINLQDREAVRQAYEEMLRSVRTLRPEAQIEGVTLQRHVALRYGMELILGSRRDPTFGPVIMVGLGGITTEILRDCSFELPPLDEHLTRLMLERLRAWPLLNGFRGRPALAVDKLIETILRFSTLIVECPAIEELDINPLLVAPDEVLALDARVLVNSQQGGHARAYGHLAIAPYPEDAVRQGTCKDGTPVTFRPIRPEDEPLWHEMVDAASDQSLLFRFRSMFRSVVHHQAARYCFIDYDREMAFVAQVVSEGQNKLVAVARLVSDRQHEAAEFGVLIIDKYQGLGLGGQLLALCLDYARRAGYKSVYAETSWDNVRMLTLFRKHGFTIGHFANDLTTLSATLSL